MSKVKFNIGDHSSFTEMAAEGSINFLTYDTMKSIGLCIKKNSETYGLGTMRLIPISRDTSDDDNGNVTFLAQEDSYFSLMKGLKYKILPILIEFIDAKRTQYNLYYYTMINALKGMTFYCPTNNIEIFYDPDINIFGWRKGENSINWTDF